MRSQLRFGWKEVGEVWWLFVCMIIICGMALWIAKTPRIDDFQRQKAVENEVYNKLMNENKEE